MEYFQVCMTSQLADGFEIDFWNHSVMQLCLSDAGVRDSALAASSLHRLECYADLDKSITDLQQNAFAVRHYFKAIKNLMSLTSKDVARNIVPTLTSCVLLVCFEVS